MGNGDLIKEVRELLRNPKGMTSEQGQVMTLTLLADLYEKWEADHQKVETMWPAYNIGKWLVIALGGANITLLIGLLTHSFKFP